MEDSSFLNYFISEDIFLIDSSNQTINTEKKPLVVTPTPLSNEDKEFLFKIFASVNVTTDMLDLGGTDAQHKDHSIVFFFGTKPVMKSVDYYKEFALENCTAIVAHSLSEIAEDTTKKKALWTVLKSRFP